MTGTYGRRLNKPDNQCVLKWLLECRAPQRTGSCSLPNPSTTQKVKTPKQKDLPFLKGETFELSQLSTVQLQLECGLSKSEDGGGKKFNQRSSEVRRTRYHVGLARVASPQVT